MDYLACCCQESACSVFCLLLYYYRRQTILALKVSALFHLEAQRLWSEPGLYTPHYHPELSDVSVLPYEKPESVVVDVINQHEARGFRYAV